MLTHETAERCVLGSILVNNALLPDALAIVEADDFAIEFHQRVYEAMLGLSKADQPVDLVTVYHALQTAPWWEKSHVPTLAALADGLPRSAHINGYALIVRGHSLRRQLAARGTGLAAACLDEDPTDLAQYVTEAEHILAGLLERHGKSDFGGPEPEPLNAADRIPSALADLDRLMDPWQPGQFVLVAARPSMGKTALLVQFAMAAAAADHPVAFASLEMTRSEVYWRMLAQQARVDLQKLTDRRIVAAARDVELVKALPIAITDAAGLTPIRLRQTVDRMRGSLGGLGMVVVDYLQLMRGDGRHETRNLEIQQISQALKALAKEQRVVVIAASQLNRGVEARRHGRPELSDLRDSGSLEQDADRVLLLHRGDTEASIRVAKNRNGPTGMVRATWVANQARFADPTLGPQ